MSQPTLRRTLLAGASVTVIGAGALLLLAMTPSRSTPIRSTLTSASAATSVDSDAMQRGDVTLSSVSALAFSPSGVLFVGDSLAGAVYALEVGEQDAKPAGTLERIDDLDQRLADLLGVGVRDVVVNDLAASPTSGTVYLGVTRGRGDDARSVLLRVQRPSAIEAVDLDDVRYSKLDLGNAPALDAGSPRRPSRPLTITDMRMVDGELIIAGLSNEEFSSTLRRAKFPFEAQATTTGLEIYHGNHGRWETQAPIFAFLPYDLGGKKQILAAYLCTPLVTFSLDDLRSHDRLRGKTIGELGNRNIPIDMVAYRQGDEQYVLLTNSRRGTMKMRASDIANAYDADAITAPVPGFAGVPYESVALGNPVHVAELDAQNLVVLERSLDSGALILSAYPKARV